MTNATPPCLSSGSSLGYLLEISKKWGIFAALTVSLGVYITWFQIQLYNENKENKQYIQHELMHELQENISSRNYLIHILEHTNDVVRECSKVLAETCKQDKQTAALQGEKSYE